MTKKLVVASGLLLSGFASAAFAGSLAGQTLRITGERPTIGVVEVGPVDVVVGAGVEVPGNFWSIYSIDISDNSVLFTLPGTCCGGFTSGAFNGIHFRDLNGTIGDFTSVTIASSTVAGFGANRISFDADNIYVSFASLNPSPSNSLSLNIEVGDAQAPEPSAWLLMGGGAASLFALRRRKRGN